MSVYSYYIGRMNSLGIWSACATATCNGIMFHIKNYLMKHYMLVILYSVCVFSVVLCLSGRYTLPYQPTSLDCMSYADGREQGGGTGAGRSEAVLT